MFERQLLAAYSSEKDCYTISKLFGFHNFERKIIHNRKTFKTVASLARNGHPCKFRQSNDDCAKKTEKYPHLTPHMPQLAQEKLNFMTGQLCLQSCIEAKPKTS